MPNVNPKVAGDNFYPQYNVVTSQPVSAIIITKGRLYTKGGTITAGDQLVAPTATGFLNGIYQASVSIPVAGTAGENTVDTFGPRSRIALPAKVANMHSGQLVKYDIVNHNVELWTGTSGGITPNELNSIVGRIYKIYSKIDIATEKNITAVGDLVIIDQGEGL